ncbi:cilia- and flagella-associated protein 99 isoform X1 [Xyrichtys novacula]|uniref:Cilia- and flagella-associated protein 99 isoform X1 n=1 Tax=Xyrichtys novacula TaxID=13765 RepID=A0AAV1GKX3_XYRNO|nr:cilia- and flagella-associated protein 99 isoform X1 [Xyrichtys novacula]
MRDSVQQVAEGHKNAKVAKERLQKLKQNIEVSEQSREFLCQAREEAQADLSRKIETIREAHTIKSPPCIQMKNVDGKQTASHKLPAEMCEVKEQLALLKEAQQAELQEKREKILEEKRRKNQMLLKGLETIELHKRALAQAAAIRKQEKESRLRNQQAVPKDDRVLALQKELEEIQQEHQRLKQIQSERANTSKQAAAQSDRETEMHNRRG